MKKLDRQLVRDIEQEYYAQAQGRHIDVSKIGDLFQEAAVRVRTHGATVQHAVRDTIAIYCTPAL